MARNKAKEEAGLTDLKRRLRAELKAAANNTAKESEPIKEHVGKRYASAPVPTDPAKQIPIQYDEDIPDFDDQPGSQNGQADPNLFAFGQSIYNTEPDKLITFADLKKQAAKPFKLKRGKKCVNKTTDELNDLKKQTPYVLCSGCMTGKEKADMSAHGHYTVNAVDIDENAQPVEFYQSLLVDLGVNDYLIYKTFSSRPDAPRYRIMFPYGQTLTQAQHIAFTKHMNKVFNADGCTENGNQIAYAPITHDLNDYDHWVGAGGLNDFSALLDELATVPVEKTTSAKPKMMVDIRPDLDPNLEAFNQKHAPDIKTMQALALETGRFEKVGRTRLHFIGSSNQESANIRMDEERGHAMIHAHGETLRDAWELKNGQPIAAADLFRIVEHGGDGKKALKAIKADLGVGSTQPTEEPTKSDFYQKLLDSVSVGSDGFDKAASWLVKGVFQSGVSAIVGAFSSLKSFLAVDIACSVQTGRNWRGRTVRNGHVIYIAGEGANGIKKRIRGWEKKHGVKVELTLIPLGVSPDNVPVLIEYIKNEVTANPRLIVVDTLNRSFGTGDENSSQGMTEFIQGCDSIIQAFDESNVLVVHHTGKDATKGARGSTVFNGALESGVSCAKGGSSEAPTMTLKHEKPPKDGEAMEAMTIDMDEIELDGTDEDGDQLKTLVLGGALTIAATSAPTKTADLDEHTIDLIDATVKPSNLTDKTKQTTAYQIAFTVINRMLVDTTPENDQTRKVSAAMLKKWFETHSQKHAKGFDRSNANKAIRGCYKND